MTGVLGRTDHVKTRTYQGDACDNGGHSDAAASEGSPGVATDRQGTWKRQGSVSAQLSERIGSADTLISDAGLRWENGETTHGDDDIYPEKSLWQMMAGSQNAIAEGFLL